MNLMGKIRSKFGDYTLKRSVKKQTRKLKSCNLHQAKSIGILFDATQMVSFEIVKGLAKELSGNANDIMVLGYVDSKQMIDHYLIRKGFEFFTRNELNWYKKPHGETIDKFINKEFDILYYLNLEDLYPLRYILALSKAKFKTGKFIENDEYLDLMIDIEKEKEAMKDLQLELEKDQANTKQHRSKYDNIANVKTNIELQLNFLINQLNHYLSQIKN